MAAWVPAVTLIRPSQWRWWEATLSAPSRVAAAMRVPWTTRARRGAGVSAPVRRFSVLCPQPGSSSSGRHCRPCQSGDAGRRVADPTVTPRPTIDLQDRTDTGSWEQGMTPTPACLSRRQSDARLRPWPPADCIPAAWTPAGRPFAGVRAALLPKLCLGCACSVPHPTSMHTVAAVSGPQTNFLRSLPSRPTAAGSNSHGQLGAGMSSGFESGVYDPASYVPVEVSGNLSFTSISSGAAFSCALTQQNTAWCWGVSRLLTEGLWCFSLSPRLPLGGLYRKFRCGHTDFKTKMNE